MAPRLFQRLKDLRRDRGPKDSEELKRKQDGDSIDGTVNSAASSHPDSQIQSEHCEDDLSTPIADRNPPKDGGSDTVQSLWDSAYGALKIENPRLVKKYEKLLSRELQKTSMDPIAELMSLPLTPEQVPIRTRREVIHSIRTKKAWTRLTTGSTTRISGNVEHNWTR